ncbi:proteasome activator complex subunit [Anaeramoeba flamelloides]|uniref:Proteasome activator complex subunit n=1 Tax=Anaeramoeba flamelloides TaxID=1746091 RepID=A0AAV7Y5J1_9EUKA|nr:proteasome activator complex subunit [Anaeramoeba flamelloides]
MEEQKDNLDQLLPFYDFIEGEKEIHLETIVQNLSICLSLKDVPQQLHMILTQITKYLRVGYKMPHKDKTIILDLLIEFLKMEELDVRSLGRVCSVIQTVIQKKKEKFAYLVEWKIFFDLFHKHYHHQKRFPLNKKYELLGTSLLALVRNCRRYFHQNAGEEIWNGIYPLFTTDQTSFCYALNLAEQFLPTWNLQSMPVWAEPMIAIWNWNSNVPLYDKVFFNIFSRLIEETHNSKSPIIEEVQKFFNKYSNFFFTKLLLFMEIRFGSIKLAYPRRPNIPKRFKTLLPKYLSKLNMTDQSNIIIYSWSEKTKENFKKFLKILETYLHPNNTGKWTNKISDLLTKLIQATNKRMVKEQKIQNDDPNYFKTNGFKITNNQRDEIIEIIYSHLSGLLYSKRHQSSNLSCNGIKLMMDANPKLVIPKFMETAISVRKNQIYAHRSYAILNTICLSVVTILNNNESDENGIPFKLKYLGDIIDMSIEGIDITNLPKATISLTILKNVFSIIPIIDPQNDELVDLKLFNMEKINDTQKMFLNICSRFENIINQFLEKVLNLFDIFNNLDNEKFLKKKVLNNVAGVIFQQCSERIFKIVIKKLKLFLKDKIKPKSANIIGDFYSSIVFCNPELCLKKFLPFLFNRLLIPLNNKENNDQSNDNNYNKEKNMNVINDGNEVKANKCYKLKDLLESEKIWYLTLLKHIIVNGRNYLYDYKNELIAILKFTLFDKQKQISSISCKILQNIISTLLTMVVIESHSHNLSLWNDPRFRFEHWKYWKLCNKKELEINWYFPTRDEFDFLDVLYEEFLEPALEYFPEYIKKEKKKKNEFQKESKKRETNKEKKNTEIEKNIVMEIEIENEINNENENDKKKNELKRNLEILKSILLGSAIYFSQLTGKKYSGYEKSNYQQLYQYGYVDIECGNEIYIANDWKNRICDSIIVLFDHLLEKKSDDVECFLLLLSIIQYLTTSYGKSISITKKKHKKYKNQLKILKTVDTKKKYLRSLLIDKIEIRNNFRIAYKRYNKTVPEELIFCVKFLEKCIAHPYAKVRNKSISILKTIYRRFPFIFYNRIQKIIKILSNPNSQTHAINGCLSILCNKYILIRIIGNWELVSFFLKSLCNSWYHEKGLLQENISRLVRKFQSEFYPIDFGIKSQTLEQIQKINALQYDGFEMPDQELIDFSNTTHKKERIENINYYNDLISTLIKILEKKNQKNNVNNDENDDENLNVELIQEEISDDLEDSYFDIEDSNSDNESDYNQIKQMKGQINGKVNVSKKKKQKEKNKEEKNENHNDNENETGLQAKTQLNWKYKSIIMLVLSRLSMLTNTSNDKLFQILLKNVTNPNLQIARLARIGLNILLIRSKPIIKKKKIKALNNKNREVFENNQMNLIDISIFDKEDIYQKQIFNDKLWIGWNCDQSNSIINNYIYDYSKLYIKSDENENKDNVINTTDNDNNNNNNKNKNKNKSKQNVSNDYKNVNKLKTINNNLVSIEKYIIESNYFEKLFELMINSQTQGKEFFRYIYADTFKGLTILLRLKILKYLETPLKKYLLKSADNLIYQTIIAEVVAGIVRATKHFSHNEILTIWETIQPILQQLLYKKVNNEADQIWVKCFRYMLNNHDPKRKWFLIQFLFDNLKKQRGMFLIRNLKLINRLLLDASWKISNNTQQLIDIWFDVIDSRFINSYYQLHLMFGYILEINIDVPRNESTNLPDINSKYKSTERLQYIFEKINNKIIQTEKEFDALIEREKGIEERIKRTLNEVNSDNSTQSQVDNQELTKIKLQKKGTLKFYRILINSILKIYFSGNVYTKSLFTLIDKFLPIILNSFQKKWKDATLHDSTILIFQLISQELFIEPLDMKQEGKSLQPMKILNILFEHCKNTKEWHIKLIVLHFLQIYVFRHCFFIYEQNLKEIINFILKLILDAQTEVRELAAITFSMSIRLLSKEQLDNLQNLFQKLANIKIKKNQNTNLNLLARKHGGVLGLSSIIKSDPHKISPRTLQIFDILNNIQWSTILIKKCINSVFADFFRTHEMEVLKRELTEEKFESLIQLKHQNQEHQYFI